MEELQHGMQAHPMRGAAPELVQAIQQAALATEAEGLHDLARVLRGWAQKVEIDGESATAWERPRRSEYWLG